MQSGHYGDLGAARFGAANSDLDSPESTLAGLPAGHQPCEPIESAGPEVRPAFHTTWLPRRLASWLKVTTTALAVVMGVPLIWQLRSDFGPVPERPVAPHQLVRQWSTTTCGPAALAVVLTAFQRPWTRQGLERECRVRSNGSSMYDLVEACRRHQLAASGMQATSATALLRVPRPFIAHLAIGHYVVIMRQRAGRLVAFDPTSGIIREWTPSELYRRTDGWVIAVSTAERPFQP